MPVARDRGWAANRPLVVHLGVLVLGFAVLAAVAARAWFFYDDWYFLRSLPEAAWAPHVGHWNAVPALVFMGLQRIFGMDHYLPFAVPAIVAHLTVVHLVWRLMLRAGVRPWLATAFSVLLTFLGAGAEALGWAVQIGFVGAIAAMLGAVLLVDRAPLTVRTGVLVAGLALVAVASSGTALPLLAVVVALGCVRHGVWRTALVAGTPVVAAGAWYLTQGRQDPAIDRAGSLAELLTVPQFAVTMLTDGLGRAFPVAVLGAAVFVALGTWWLFAVRGGADTTLAPRLLFLAAPVFALATGYSRIGAGLETATSSRYVYLVVVCIAPWMALGLDRLTRGAATGPALAIVLLVALWNAGGLALALSERIHRVNDTRAELAAAAAWIGDGRGCLADDERPSPRWAPDVTVVDVREWLDRGWYHPGTVAAPAPACSGP